MFRHVTLPAALPAVGVAALWVALSAAGEMTVTDLFAVRTYAEEVYTLLAVGQEPGMAPLRVLPGVAMTAVLVVAGMVLCRGLMPGDRPLSARPAPLGLPAGTLAAAGGRVGGRVAAAVDRRAAGQSGVQGRAWSSRRPRPAGSASSRPANAWR